MTEAEKRDWAGLVCGPLFAAWGGADVRRPVSLDAELTRIGLLARNASVVAACALNPVGTASAGHDYPMAALLGRECIELLDEARHPVPFQLLRQTGLASQMIGEIGRASDLLRRAVSDTESQDSVEAAQALAEYGQLLIGRGDIERAEENLKDEG